MLFYVVLQYINIFKGYLGLNSVILINNKNLDISLVCICVKKAEKSSASMRVKMVDMFGLNEGQKGNHMSGLHGVKKVSTCPVCLRVKRANICPL